MTIDFKEVEAWVASFFASDNSGHDLAHILRVVSNSQKIGELEGLTPAELHDARLLAYLHEMLDKKFFPDADLAHQQLVTQLTKWNIVGEEQEKLITSIGQISFSKRLPDNPVSLIVKVVQDADLLEAIGAIGIARTFMYGATRNTPIYDEKKAGVPNSSIIQHFYDKLLKISGLMSTAGGQKLAEKPQAFMESFLEEFYREWEGR